MKRFSNIGFSLLAMMLVFLCTVCSAGQYPEGISSGSISWHPQDLSDEQLTFIANTHTQVILGESDSSLEKVAFLKAANPDLLVFGYLNSRHLRVDSANFEECDPYESLFAHNDSGSRINHVMFDQVLANTSNAHWADRLVDWANEMPAEVDGVYLDDSRPTLHEPFYDSLPADYDSAVDTQSMETIFKTLNQSTDRTILFNGLMEGLEEDGYTQEVSGGIMEGFVFNKQSQEVKYYYFYDCLSALIDAGQQQLIVGVSAESYRRRIDNRTFAVAVYLLGANQYSTYNFMDIDHQLATNPQYYPEYDIALGAPIGNPQDVDALQDEDTRLYIRHFEQGMVVVNPWNDNIDLSLSQPYFKIVPSGGGLVGPVGITNGSLVYTPMELQTTVPAKSALILLKMQPPATLRIIN